MRAITRTDDGKVWLGGTFSELRSPKGQRLPMSNLAALLPDGSPATAPTHSFNGSVLTLSSDGTSVYAGGTFTTVDGTGALRVAKFDLAGNRLTTFASGVNGPVHASAVSAGRLYIGGKFTGVQGSSRGNLAVLDLATGTVDNAWRPVATLIAGDAAPNDAPHNNVPIRSIAPAPEGNRIYVAGDMDVLNGAPRPVIAAVDPVTGTTDPTFEPPASVNKTFQGFQIATADTTAGRTPGVVLAAGGHTNKAFRFQLDGSQAWAVNTDGDVQAAAVIGGTAYLGGHFTETCLNNCYDGSEADDSQRIHIAAFDYESSVNPAADATWAPNLGIAAAPFYYGVWTLQAFDGVLHAGGVFRGAYLAPKTFRNPKYARFETS